MSVVGKWSYVSHSFKKHNLALESDCIRLHFVLQYHKNVQVTTQSQALAIVVALNHMHEYMWRSWIILVHIVLLSRPEKR